MNHKQAGVSDQALVTAIRTNMCDFFRHVSRSDLKEHFENQQFTRWYTPLPHPWFNGMLSSRPYDEGDDAFIETTIQYFREKGIHSFTWWMEPHLSPPDWEQILPRHGFRFSNDTPGMAIDLNDLNDSLRLPDGFEIRVVNDEESLHGWVKTFINGYGLPSHWEPLAFDLWVQLGLDLPMRNYLGYLNGEPVSTSSVFFLAGALQESIVCPRCPKCEATASALRLPLNLCRMHMTWAIVWACFNPPKWD